METTIQGVRYAVDVWPTALAAVVIAAAMLLGWRERRQLTQPAADAVPDLRSKAQRPFLVPIIAAIILAAMLPPACSGIVGYAGKAHPTFFDELFVGIMLLDWLVVIGGALVALQTPPRGSWVWYPVLALCGALIALGSAWSIRLAKWHPELPEHSCLAIHKGVACELQVRAPAGWRTVEGRDLKYDQPGQYKVPVRLRSGLAEVSGTITVQVGEDRGSPLFAPRVGDVWSFDYEKSSSTHVLLVVSQGRSKNRQEGPVVRGLRELKAHGRRWVQIEVESKQRDDKDVVTLHKELAWVYFLDGETYVMPDRNGAPQWSAIDRLQRAISRPDLEPEPTELTARNDHQRTLARVPSAQGGVGAVTVPCVFSFFELSCRCAERGIDGARSLPGPVVCYVDSSGLKTVGLLLLTGFTVLMHDSTILVQSASENQAGLPPPQPPYGALPTQEELDRQAAETEAAQPSDIARDAYKQELAATLAKGLPAFRFCLNRGPHRHGSADIKLFLDRQGKALDVELKSPVLATLPVINACLLKALKNSSYPDPPSGGIRIEATMKF